MSFVFRAMLGSMFLLVMALPLRADDADTAKAIIEKAIKAAGSEEKFTKLKAATMKFKGIIHQPDMNISFTGEIVSQPRFTSKGANVPASSHPAAKSREVSSNCPASKSWLSRKTVRNAGIEGVVMRRTGQSAAANGIWIPRRQSILACPKKRGNRQSGWFFPVL